MNYQELIKKHDLSIKYLCLIDKADKKIKNCLQRIAVYRNTFPDFVRDSWLMIGRTKKVKEYLKEKYIYLNT